MRGLGATCLPPSSLSTCTALAHRRESERENVAQNLALEECSQSAREPSKTLAAAMAADAAALLSNCIRHLSIHKSRINLPHPPFSRQLTRYPTPLIDASPHPYLTTSFSPTLSSLFKRHKTKFKTTTDLCGQCSTARFRRALEPRSAGAGGDTPHRAAEHGEPPVLERAAGDRERCGGHQGRALRRRDSRW